MIRIIFFLLGFFVSASLLLGFYCVYKGINRKNANTTGSRTLSFEEEKMQKEIERQYNNMMNYNGKAQRGADDEN